jgi:two-component system, chemotaxis family, chemotaxis protein CheY
MSFEFVMDHSDFSTLSALVVDDQPGMRRVIINILHEFGLRKVYEAGSGDEALEACIHDKPDIMFTDAAMSPMTGEALTHKIREGVDGIPQNLPIVMVSGHSELERIKFARDSGITDFLVKPISAKQVYNHLLSAIEHPRTFVRSDKFVGPDRRRHKNEFRGDEKRDDN